MNDSTTTELTCTWCLAMYGAARPTPGFIDVGEDRIKLMYQCTPYGECADADSSTAYLRAGHAGRAAAPFAQLAREGRPVPMSQGGHALGDPKRGKPGNPKSLEIAAAIRAAFPERQWPEGAPFAAKASKPAPAEGAEGAKGSSKPAPAGEYTLAGVLSALTRWEGYSGRAGLGGRACRAAIDALTAAKDHVQCNVPIIVAGCTVRFKPALVEEFEALKSLPEGLLSELASVEMVAGNLPATFTVESTAGPSVNAYIGEGVRFGTGHKYAGMLNRPAMTGRYFTIRADALEWCEPAPSAPSAPSDPTPSDPTPSDPTPVVDLNE